MRSKWTGLGIAAALAVLVGAYQNCAQSPESANPAASQEVDHLVTAMEVPKNGDEARAITSQKVASADCRIESLRCFRKVYSPELQDFNGTESLCVEGTCLNVQTYVYNTRDALSVCEDCDTQAAAPGGAYNREEYTCWLGEPGQASEQAFALRSTLAEAMTATMAACSGDQR